MAKRRIRKRSTRVSKSKYRRLSLDKDGLDDVHRRALRGNRTAGHFYAQRKMEQFREANVLKKKRHHGQAGPNDLPVIIGDATIGFHASFDMVRKRPEITMTISVPENISLLQHWADLWPVVSAWRRRLTLFQGALNDTGFDATYKQMRDWKKANGGSERKTIDKLNRSIRDSLLEVSLLTQLIDEPEDQAGFERDMRKLRGDDFKGVLRDEDFKHALSRVEKEVTNWPLNDKIVKHLTFWRDMNMQTAFRYLSAFHALKPGSGTEITGTDLLELALDPSQRKAMLEEFGLAGRKLFPFPITRDQFNARLSQWDKAKDNRVKEKLPRKRKPKVRTTSS